jgi:hypothetical protein
MLSKALEMGVSFQKGPALGNMNALFLGPLREGKKIFN